ncbi:hypothetical protein JIN84_01820 [Luteolibacter yonseiensis]|uniref:Uncharacterized protein n=1 Tax=Luteolibacter yonseiensis TaxID=1144680 RepID=A0A934QZY1_9BACT|nr:hypothetical protein [Luteolibacter yonseiensis]MBK1814331.1 hypothetical protein [Luteolibacter yonseiensis]
MKISIAVTFLILTLAAGIGWTDRQRLIVATARNARLVSRAAELRIPASSPTLEHSAPVTKRDRDTHDTVARESVGRFLAWMRQLDEIQKTGLAIDDATQKEVMMQLASFGPSEMEMLLIEVLDKNEFGGKLRDVVLSIPMLKLASVNPLTALRLLPKFSATTREDSDPILAKVIETSLPAGGRTDPLATVAWLRENGGNYSKFIREDDKRGILSGVGRKDPALAFKLIGDLEIKDNHQALKAILSAPKTPEERTATLTVLRQHLATITDEDSRKEMSKSAVAHLANCSHQYGYDTTIEWLASARLTPAESDAFLSTLVYSNVKKDAPKWIGWMEENLPPDRADEHVSTMMIDWTRQDYQAAGKWLATTPQGAARNTAVRAYATTVSTYEPEAATQWAMTLPAGKDRERTLRQIYDNWPQEESAAKAGFAREHGIR